MKLLTAQTSEGPRVAAKLEGGILIISQASATFPDVISPLPPTLDEVVMSDGGVERFVATVAPILSDPRTTSLLLPEDKVKLAKPFQPRNIVCVGLNYRDHAEESNITPPTQPVLFAKWTSAAGGQGDPIVIPPDTAEVDYEAELAVIIGKKCRGVSSAEALNYVAGYSCMNDVSARDFQRGDGQWVRAKSQDTFGPFGPYLVTREEIPDPQVLPIRCVLNDRVLQNSNTSKMIFSVRELIAFITRGITLNPGDIISTGTPHGVGFAQKPPVFLKPGDTVTVEIDGVGRLSNSVAAG
jgi:2-keto-4-pentenoate hydratase/2-oxohepta-3-ene-1,7-dioic acid hydratase in catechol pathway